MLAMRSRSRVFAALALLLAAPQPGGTAEAQGAATIELRIAYQNPATGLTFMPLTNREGGWYVASQRVVADDDIVDVFMKRQGSRTAFAVHLSPSGAMRFMSSTPQDSGAHLALLVEGKLVNVLRILDPFRVGERRVLFIGAETAFLPDGSEQRIAQRWRLKDPAQRDSLSR